MMESLSKSEMTFLLLFVVTCLHVCPDPRWLCVSCCSVEEISEQEPLQDSDIISQKETIKFARTKIKWYHM